MNFQPFIYGLIDPVDPGHVRYVGMAGVRESRPYQHARWARNRSIKPCHLLHWLRKLQSQEREYQVIKLEELSADTSRQFLGQVERMYISALRQIGHDLVNESEGGLGGNFLTPEANAKRAVKQLNNRRGLGVVHSEAARQAVSESRKRYFANHPEARQIISDRNLGNKYALAKPRSEETRKKISDKQKGVPRKKGYRFSDEQLSLRADALRRYNADPANQEALAERRHRQRLTLLATNAKRRT